MTGIAVVALLALLGLALLHVIGLRGPLMLLSAAALALGGAGYALQGRPDLPGNPRDPAMKRRATLPLTEVRKAMMGEFTAANSWLTISESYAARGKTLEAAAILRSAVRERPGDYSLWVGYGNALSDHARTITPAARLAYERALRLAPGHPAPRFFLGLALARSGDREEALTQWRAILAETPANASWRHFVEDGVAALETAR